jgi:hypothetical protein
MDHLKKSWFNQGRFTHQSLERDPISQKMAKWEPKRWIYRIGGNSIYDSRIIHKYAVAFKALNQKD